MILTRAQVFSLWNIVVHEASRAETVRLKPKEDRLFAEAKTEYGVLIYHVPKSGGLERVDVPDEVEPLVCELHDDCDESVIAKIGLPGRDAIWVCREGFDQWREQNV